MNHVAAETARGRNGPGSGRELHEVGARALYDARDAERQAIADKILDLEWDIPEASRELELATEALKAARVRNAAEEAEEAAGSANTPTKRCSYLQLQF